MAAAEPRQEEETKKTPNEKEKYKADKKTRVEISIPPIDPKKIFRVTFNEITPKAIRAAFEKPRQLDSNLVDAQQARRGLDRIVGDQILPLPWGKRGGGRFGGAVRDVAMGVVERAEQPVHT